MAAQQKSPKTVTIYGRLSFPTFTAQEAYDRSQKGSYPAADVASASPDFQLLVEQAQLDKLLGHIESTFLPYCVQQEAAGEKRDVLSKKEAADLLKQVKTLDPDGVYNTPVKPVHEKTAPLAPEAVATVKVIGGRGSDIELRAIVNDEQELLVPDPALLTFPVVKPIGQTVHTMYAGAYVACTLNLYAYHNGKLPGFSAGATVAVFKADGDRIGGGTAVDEDEIFTD
jgi:Protein of unknown function (DUF2815)